jgi:hypothetical protein
MVLDHDNLTNETSRFKKIHSFLHPHSRMVPEAINVKKCGYFFPTLTTQIQNLRPSQYRFDIYLYHRKSNDQETMSTNGNGNVPTETSRLVSGGQGEQPKIIETRRLVYQVRVLCAGVDGAYCRHCWRSLAPSS